MVEKTQRMIHDRAIKMDKLSNWAGLRDRMDVVLVPVPSLFTSSQPGPCFAVSHEAYCQCCEMKKIQEAYFGSLGNRNRAT